MGVSDHVMESITGRPSRRTLEHYSHIRRQAKRETLDELGARRAETIKGNQIRMRLPRLFNRLSLSDVTIPVTIDSEESMLDLLTYST